MKLDPTTLDLRDIHRVSTAAIAPRPVVLVSLILAQRARAKVDRQRSTDDTNDQ